MGEARTKIQCVQCLLVWSIVSITGSAAKEEFDKLCFEFGIELDEDVRA